MASAEDIQVGDYGRARRAAARAEVDRQFAAYCAQVRESQRQRDERQREWDEYCAERDREWAERQREWDEYCAERDREWAERDREREARWKRGERLVYLLLVLWFTALTALGVMLVRLL